MTFPRAAGPRTGLAVLLAAMLATVSLTAACGDGSTPAPPTPSTLAPGSDGSPGPRGSSSASPSPSTVSPVGTPLPQPTNQSPQAVTDKSIRRHILARFAASPSLRNAVIRVVVYNRAVSLYGELKSAEQKTHAEQIAVSEPGIEKVVSYLTVKQTPGYGEGANQ